MKQAWNIKTFAMFVRLTLLNFILYCLDFEPEKCLIATSDRSCDVCAYGYDKFIENSQTTCYCKIMKFNNFRMLKYLIKSINLSNKMQLY